MKAKKIEEFLCYKHVLSPGGHLSLRIQSTVEHIVLKNKKQQKSVLQQGRIKFDNNWCNYGEKMVSCGLDLCQVKTAKKIGCKTYSCKKMMDLWVKIERTCWPFLYLKTTSS